MATQSREDYLRGLYILGEQGSEIKSRDLAAYLKVSKSGVSQMIRQLREDGLVSFDRYSSISFTPKGIAAARKLTSKHRLIELFLKKVLKVKKIDIHEEAHRLEHAFSDESIRQIQKILHNPVEDPHGEPIPKVRWR